MNFKKTLPILGMFIAIIVADLGFGGSMSNFFMEGEYVSALLLLCGFLFLGYLTREIIMKRILGINLEAPSEADTDEQEKYSFILNFYLLRICTIIKNIRHCTKTFDGTFDVSYAKKNHYGDDSLNKDFNLSCAFSWPCSADC